MIFGILVIILYSVQYSAYNFNEKSLSGFYTSITRKNSLNIKKNSYEHPGFVILKSGPINIMSHLNNLIFIWLLTISFILYNNPFSQSFLYSGVFARTKLSNALEVFLFIFAAFILQIGKKHIGKIMHVEFLILICLCLIGQNLLLMSVDLISLYICLELQTFCLVVLCSINYKSIFNVEAGIKYFLLSAFSSALLLLGISLIYWSTGLTNLTALNNIFSYVSETSHQSLLVFGIWLVSLSLLWKLSAAPLHMWAADVYQGANSIVTLFISTLPKVAVLGFWVNIWQVSVYFGSLIDILVFFSALSLLIGALAALGQVNIKRLMAYSSIAHMGFLLMPLCSIGGSSSALITHLIIYLLTSLVVWGLIMWPFRRPGAHHFTTAQYLWDYAVLSRYHPLASWTWAIVMMSLAGLPPIAGFLGKLYIFLWSLSSHQYALLAIAVISTLISSVYYLRLIRIMYIDNLKSYSIFQKMDTTIAYIISFLIFLLLILLFYSSPIVLLSHLLII